MTFTREGRVVVKLVPEALVEAETVAQATVGFEAGSSRPVGRVRQRAIGFPAWPIITDPGNARHALNLVGDLEWARRHARANPKKVQERFEGLVEGLRGSAPHFVPTLLEELARIFVAADREKHARRWFALARDIERAHGLPVDAARHEAAFLEFAANGVVGASELTREAGDAMERFDDPSEAFEHVLRLNCARIRAGQPPHANCARDLRKVGAAAGISADDADDRLFDAIVGMSAVDSAPPGFWKTTQTSLARWLRANPGRADHFVEVKADSWSLDEWIGFLEESGEWARLAADPDALQAWIRKVVDCGGFPLLAIVSPRFVAAIESLGTKLRGTRVSARFSDLAVDHVDVLTAAGVEWDGESQLRFDRSLRWRDWARSGVRTRTLETLLHDPVLADLVDDVVPSWILGTDPDHFLATEGGRRTIGRKLREVADAHAANMASPTTLAYIHEHHVRHLLDPRLAGVDPEAAAALRSYDPAETLAGAIRVGVLAELALPAVEESARRMVPPGNTEWWKGAGTVRVFDSYPRLIVVVGDRFAAVDGDSVVVEGQIPPGAGHVTGALTVGDELAFFNGAPGGWTNHVHWYRGPTAAMQDPYISFVGMTVENAEGRITVGGLLTALDVTVAGLSFQKLACTADTSRVFAHIDGAMREWLPAERGFSSEPVDVGAIPGILGIGPLPANDGISYCQAYPAQPDTVDGPAGSAGGLHFAIGYRLGDEWGVTTPLGDFRAREPIASVVRRPGGGHWLMGADMRLRNPDTGAYLAGRNGLLDGLPPSAVHRMRPRSPWVSELMRAFTRESAAELLSAMTGDSERGFDFRDVPADLKLSDVENRYSTERWRPSVDARPGTSAWETASRLLGTSDPLLLNAVIELAADAIELDRRVKVLLPAAERAAERFTVSAKAMHLVGCLSGDLVVMGGSKEFAESLGAIADELASPGTTDGRIIDTPGLVRHIGHERGLVALLAAPALDRALVREAVGLLRELVETGVLCSGWRAHLLEAPKGNRRPNMRKMRWEDDALFVGFMVDDAGAWRCYLARDDSRWAAAHAATTRATDGAGNADDDGMNADDFLADLAVLEERAAHANHDASGSGSGEAKREAPWSVRGKAAELASATDLSEDAAAYLVGGIASRSSAHGALEEEQRERTDAVREALGMTAAAFTRARDRVRALPWATIRNMAIAGLPGGDVRRMAEEGPDVSAMAAVWARETGDLGFRLSEFERAAIRRPLDKERIVRYPDEVLDELLRPFDFKTTDPDSVDHYVAPLLILASLRPPGDPIRPFIGEQLRAIAEQAPACRERRARYLSGVELGGDFEDINGHPSLQTHRVLLEGHLDELLADLERDPAAAPASPAKRGAAPNPMDPANSAPDTVAAAMESLGIDENATRYFLQILALADPSDANVRAWNGWRKKDIDAAAGVLVDKGLLIEGRRAGAGRTRFLPGGWMEPGPGEKTMETWKAPLHLLWRDAKVRPVVPTSPPLVPLPSLYARAWERFAGGDVPGYGELSTERYRGR
ncbi:hypothetical protein ACFORJ_12325 [Corynebacterium hansenii]|uniref:DNA-binding protein n=1 Tax=Corynebacterium hansenii TaxID=394964 RepID=A0ABV7ZRY3_9CORY|nr:hypothetical protein [Corynebacterium hansenii]